MKSILSTTDITQLHSCCRETALKIMREIGLVDVGSREYHVFSVDRDRWLEKRRLPKYRGMEERRRKSTLEQNREVYRRA